MGVAKKIKKPGTEKVPVGTRLLVFAVVVATASLRRPSPGGGVPPRGRPVWCEGEFWNLMEVLMVNVISHTS